MPLSAEGFDVETMSRTSRHAGASLPHRAEPSPGAWSLEAYSRRRGRRNKPPPVLLDPGDARYFKQVVAIRTPACRPTPRSGCRVDRPFGRRSDRYPPCSVAVTRRGAAEDGFWCSRPVPRRDDDEMPCEQRTAGVTASTVGRCPKNPFRLIALLPSPSGGRPSCGRRFSPVRTLTMHPGQSRAPRWSTRRTTVFSHRSPIGSMVRPASARSGAHVITSGSGNSSHRRPWKEGCLGHHQVSVTEGCRGAQRC